MNTIELTNIPVKQAEVNGTKLAYIEQGSGETIVFIHGEVMPRLKVTESI